MEHYLPDVFGLRALGENVGTTAVDTHLAPCARCLADLEQLRAVVGGARGRETHDMVPLAMVAPPAAVWESITDELKLVPATRLASRWPVDVCRIEYRRGKHRPATQPPRRGTRGTAPDPVPTRSVTARSCRHGGDLGGRHWRLVGLWADDQGRRHQGHCVDDDVNTAE